MAFVPLFFDSFDHYTDLAQKWTSPGANGGISNNPGTARTGTQALVMNGTSGPQKAIGVQTAIIVGDAWAPAVLGGRFLILYNSGAGDERFDLQLNSDGSVTVTSANSHIPLGTTAPGLVTIGIYSYFELAVYMSGTSTVIWLRINGQAVAPFNPGLFSGFAGDHVDLIVLTGPGGIGGGSHDDIYVGYSDSPATIQNDFLGAVRIYPLIPSANKTPLQWTPLAGTNFSEVNQIPPPGDTAYVSDGTVGDIDQYQMDFISGQGPVGSYSIPCGQTVVCAKLDAAGSRLIAPDIGGHVGASVALTTGYAMYEQQYTLNPVTGLPFAPSDFTTTFMGPKVTG